MWSNGKRVAEPATSGVGEGAVKRGKSSMNKQRTLSTPLSTRPSVWTPKVVQVATPWTVAPSIATPLLCNNGLAVLEELTMKLLPANNKMPDNSHAHAWLLRCGIQDLGAELLRVKQEVQKQVATAQQVAELQCKQLYEKEKQLLHDRYKLALDEISVKHQRELIEVQHKCVQMLVVRVRAQTHANPYNPDTDNQHASQLHMMVHVPCMLCPVHATNPASS